MQNYSYVSEDIIYVGGSDRRAELFESAFPLPRGVAYNSYLLLDEKTVLFDTVDLSVAEGFFENLSHALSGRKLDYLVVHHVEPDHSATFLRLLQTYPGVKVVASVKAVQMLSNFFSFDSANVQVVKEGERLQTGKHTLQFISAPMVHWPEVIMTFDESTGTLFSADAFGTFGALNGSIFADEVNFERDYLDEARRYYFNIVGKYGVQVQNVLKKTAGLEIKYICPLHGPVWRKDIAWYLQKYQIWSSYQPEEEGVVIFYASIYGHTANAAEIIGKELAHLGVNNIVLYDVSQTEVSYLVEEAFRYSHLVFASCTYNNGIFVNMERFLHDLRAHALQNRKYSLVENGSWAPQAGKLMEEEISAWKSMQKLGETVSLLSSVKEDSAQKLKELAEQIAADFR